MLFPQGEGGFIANTSYRQIGDDDHDEGPALAVLARRRAQPHNKITLMDWAAFVIQARSEAYGYSNHILQGARLFHEFLVDVYVQIEGQRLSYLRHNQHIIRSELYRGLRDALYGDDHRVGVPMLGNEVGVVQSVVLPSSFTGSPRDMQQHYHDAMAIVREHGKPDLFITMTCNPNWPEIQEALLPGGLLLQ